MLKCLGLAFAWHLGLAFAEIFAFACCLKNIFGWAAGRTAWVLSCINISSRAGERLSARWLYSLKLVGALLVHLAARLF